MMDKTGIIILNYNSYLLTIDCLKSIIETHSNNKAQIIIVDNYSTNNSVEKLLAYGVFINKKIILIGEKNELNNNDYLAINEDIIYVLLLKTNKGFAAGNNAGAVFAKRLGLKYLFFINNDIIFIKNIISRLIEISNKYNDIGLLTPIVHDKYRNIEVNIARKKPTPLQVILSNSIFNELNMFRNYINKQYLQFEGITQDQILFADIICGCSMFFCLDVFFKIGGFDENTFLYFEENIISERLKKHNLKTAIAKDIFLVHIGSGTTSNVKNIKLLKHQKNSVLYYLINYLKAGTGYIYIFYILYLIKKIIIILKIKL